MNTEKCVYDIWIPLVGRDDWYKICSCDKVEHVAAVVTALMNAVEGPYEIKVSKTKTFL